MTFYKYIVLFPIAYFTLGPLLYGTAVYVDGVIRQREIKRQERENESFAEARREQQKSIDLQESDRLSRVEEQTSLQNDVRVQSLDG